eukprot:COSAG02_NODE_3341_length_6900_cov_19.222173_4_plen_69_part_00
MGPHMMAHHLTLGSLGFNGDVLMWRIHSSKRKHERIDTRHNALRFFVPKDFSQNQDGRYPSSGASEHW